MADARDPGIERHSEKQLRWFATAFRESAFEYRLKAVKLDAKAIRYLKRADKIAKSESC